MGIVCRKRQTAEVAGKQQDKTAGRQAQGKQVRNICKKRQAAVVAGKQQDKTAGRQKASKW